ncbi:helix-turn-helix domain-containing protein [Nonomuraea sp. NPDC059007]|uniref:helix-turn-helix domain-containing protein n=1 Tax=Nonomuraea sp. NPDC059007 TaxID=3346692 RepID=UPI0036A60CB5
MDSERNHRLGEFLRARRAQAQPQQIGLAVDGRRRVPGLRREEVARLAGLSPGHYARLEQGRGPRPTHQTLRSLSRVLRLSGDDAVTLYRLARPVSQRRRPDRVERVNPDVLALLNDWTVAPAYVLGWSLDILVRNPLAAALHSHFVLGDNLLRMIFLDPAGGEFFRDWTIAARAAVQELRKAADQAPEARQVRELVGELSIASPDFRRLWAEPEPRGAMVHGRRFFQPHVGELRLSTEVFPIVSSPGQRLIAHPAEPGSRSAEALTLLGTLTVQR